jgi:biotin carboxyl carrier protein/CheY-like chemotaxis protein
MGEWDAEATQIRAFPFVGADRILVADSDLFRRAWLRNAVSGAFGIEEVDNARAALERLTGDPPRILVVGSDLADISGGVLLAHAARHGLIGSHRGGPVVFLLADSPETSAQVDEAVVPVFYRLTPSLQPERLRDLLHHALAKGAPQPASRVVTEEAAARSRQIVEHAKKIGLQQDVKSAARAAIAAVIDIVRADRARCLYYDDDSGALWSETEDGVDEASASAGVAGFAARAGSTVTLARAAADPAYRPHVDDPAGTGDERLAIQPVADRDGAIHAVLIAIREKDNPEFTEGELKGLKELADGWAPFIHQLALEAEVESAAADRPDEMFRQEAINHMIRRGHQGDVVRVHPAWINSAFWIVVATVLASVGFAAVAEVHQYAEGPSVVRITGRKDLQAFDGGTVIGIEVKVGQEVTENQVLLRLHDTDQASRLRGLESEYERKLVAYLLAPADPAVRDALSALVAQRESAQANLEARAIRAPYDGVVRDIKVSVGQRVDPGTQVVSVARKDAVEGLAVVAFLPGSDRPRIRLHQPLRITLPGYRGANVSSKITAISADVIGAQQAKAKYLDHLGDSLPMSGTVVVVQGMLPPTFEADGKTYELHDGMIGRAEVQLESKTVLETAIPGLDE